LYPVTPADGLAVQFSSTESAVPEIVKEYDCVRALLAESVTRRVGVNVPEVLGVPLMFPVVAANATALGSEPELMLQV
jgi:hypothetical protein